MSIIEFIFLVFLYSLAVVAALFTTVIVGAWTGWSVVKLYRLWKGEPY